MLENVHETCLAFELRERGLDVQQQVHVPIQYRDLRLDGGLRVDLLVSESVVVELKAVESLLPIYKAQVLTYLKLTGLRLDLLINLNVPLIKDGIRRVVL